MELADQKIVEVKVMKNKLETYVYDNRAYLDSYGDRAQYLEESQREIFLSELNAAEDWLYNDGANASKGQYEEKLN
jgi:heat shock 70kDa protein 4